MAALLVATLAALLPLLPLATPAQPDPGWTSLLEESSRQDQGYDQPGARRPKLFTGDHYNTDHGDSYKLYHGDDYKTPKPYHEQGDWAGGGYEDHTDRHPWTSLLWAGEGGHGGDGGDGHHSDQGAHRDTDFSDYFNEVNHHNYRRNASRKVKLRLWTSAKLHTRLLQTGDVEGKQFGLGLGISPLHLLAPGYYRPGQVFQVPGIQGGRPPVRPKPATTTTTTTTTTTRTVRTT